jgi:hypothetical protein
MKKWANELSRAFSKEEVRMAKTHMKKCSPSLATKEMQIKSTLRFQLTSVKTATIKNTNNKCSRGWGWGGKESPCTAVGNVSQYNHNGKQYRGSLKTKNRSAIGSSNTTLRKIPEGI